MNLDICKSHVLISLHNKSHCWNNNNNVFIGFEVFHGFIYSNNSKIVISEFFLYYVIFAYISWIFTRVHILHQFRYWQFFFIVFFYYGYYFTMVFYESFIFSWYEIVVVVFEKTNKGYHLCKHSLLVLATIEIYKWD